MKTGIPKESISTPRERPRSPWKLAAELLFVAWVVAINLLYYAQFKELALRHLGRFLHR